MEIYNKRLTHTSKTTLGQLSLYDFSTPFGFIIEDEPRAVKLSSNTRIPAGRYELGIRKDLTPLTIKHQKSKWYRGWFEYHIEVLNVPNFTGIYFHLGNNEKHTAGCQIGSKHVNIVNGEYACNNSQEMIKEFYNIVYPKLLNGEKVYYTIIDE